MIFWHIFLWFCELYLSVFVKLISLVTTLISSVPAWFTLPRKVPPRIGASLTHSGELLHKSLIALFLMKITTVLIQGVFLSAPANFITKMKTANQPITANKIYWNSSCDWLIGGFLFGANIVEGQLKKSPCRICRYFFSWQQFTVFNLKDIWHKMSSFEESRISHSVCLEHI